MHSSLVLTYEQRRRSQIDALLKLQGGEVQVTVNGVDVFHPNTGEVRSDGPKASPTG